MEGNLSVAPMFEEGGAKKVVSPMCGYVGALTQAFGEETAATKALRKRWTPTLSSPKDATLFCK